MNDENLKDKITDEDKNKIQGEVENLKKVNDGLNSDTMSDADVATLKTATEALSKVVNDFTTRLYQQAGPQAGAGPDMSGGAQNNQNGNDDVIDM